MSIGTPDRRHQRHGYQLVQWQQIDGMQHKVALPEETQRNIAVATWIIGDKFEICTPTQHGATATYAFTKTI
eukprot:5293362-Amphidinium_carterae.1